MSWLPNETSDQYAAMLLAPENTTASTAACVNGVEGTTAGGVGLKLSRITSTDAVEGAAATPFSAGAGESAVIDSGVIVVPLRVPLTSTRIPGFMSVGASATSSSVPRPLPSWTVQTNSLVPASQL